MTLTKVGRKLIPIYIGLSFILWCVLTSLGTDGYISLIRAFSIMSTSGISAPEKFESDGAGFLGEFAMAIFLLLALSHSIIYSLNKKASLKKIISDKEIRLGLFTVSCITIVLSLKDMSLISAELNLNSSFLSGLKLVWGNFFTSLSFITTNGYFSSYWVGQSSSVEMPHVTIVLIGLCLFGGGLATTAGGIKLLRISILFSAFSNETGKLLHPSSMAGTDFNLKRLEISVFTSISNIFSTFLFFWIKQINFIPGLYDGSTLRNTKTLKNFVYLIILIFSVFVRYISHMNDQISS